MHVHRRRILLMRHGAVEYFDAAGRPYPPDDVPLTPRGVEHVLDAAGMKVPVEHRGELQEIRGSSLSNIPDAELRAAFIAAFEGPVPLETRFLNGESVGELLDRSLPALQRLLAEDDWDTVLAVLHGGVNRGLLSWFLTGQRIFLGGLAQDPGCLNVIDVGPTLATSIVRVVNFCALDTLQTASRLSTMEHLLSQYMKLRSGRGTGEAR